MNKRAIVDYIKWWRFWLNLASVVFAISFITVLFFDPVSMLAIEIAQLLATPFPFGSLTPETVRSLIVDLMAFGFYAAVVSLVIGFVLLSRQDDPKSQ